MLIRKLAAFLMAICIVLISCTGVVVHASEDTAWTELLQYATVNDSGSNWIKYTSNAMVSIKTPYSMRLAKIDMLLTYPSGTCPSRIEVFYSSTLYRLTISQIDDTTCRVYGTIQNNFYSDVKIKFTSGKSTATYVEILSCRVSQVVSQETVAEAQVFAEDAFYPTGTLIEVPANSLDMTFQNQIRIDVYDWKKYDTLTIWGSANYMGLSSVRASIGTVGVPFEMSFTQSIPTGETGGYDDRYTYTDYTTSSGGYGNTYGDINIAPKYNAKILFCITIDLTGMDRTYSHGGDEYPLYVYLTGTYTGLYGYNFNCQYANGSITIPDKSDATWWYKITQFFTDLMNPDNSEVEEFGQEASDMADQMENMNQQLDEVEKPAVEDIQMGVDGLVPSADVAVVNTQFAMITQHPLVLTMTLISLTVALVAYILYGKR